MTLAVALEAKVCVVAEGLNQHFVLLLGQHWLHVLPAPHFVNPKLSHLFFCFQVFFKARVTFCSTLELTRLIQEAYWLVHPSPSSSFATRVFH